MKLKEAGKVGSLLGKGYAEEFFRLLLNYSDISASEAASRLDLHIKTAQDFLETMTAFGLIKREEVFEKKRPYFRYSLVQKKMSMDIDLTYLENPPPHTDKLTMKIRERKNANVRFTAARSHRAISRVFLWSGTGKHRRERILNLTLNQGKFLFHLPFPTAEPMGITDIMEQAELAPESAPEILDIVTLLTHHSVIEAPLKSNKRR